MSQAVQEALSASLQENRRALTEPECTSLARQAGLTTPPSLLLGLEDPIDAADLAALGTSHVVIKIVSPDILHKTEVGGVRLCAAEVDQVSRAVREVVDLVARRAPRADLRGVMVVAAVDYPRDRVGHELLLTLRRDPAFGPLAVLGIGGTRTEWFGAISGGRSVIAISLDGLDAARAVSSIEATELGALFLSPPRGGGAPLVDADALTEILSGLADLAATRFAMPGGDVGVIEELELNPVVPVEGRLVALDGVGTLGLMNAPDRPPRPIAEIEALLHPRSAVVLGASSRGSNPGRIILQNLKRAEGLRFGKLWAIHPRETEIDRVACVPSVAELPEKVDLAVVAIPADRAPGAIAELAETGAARAIILIPGGFEETGARDGADAIRATLARSRSRPDGGSVMIGGNCLGVVAKHAYNTFFLPSYKLPFHDAAGDNLVVVSQSGAYLVTFTSNLDGIVFPRASISYGNEMDLTASDLLAYYLDHEPEARVFAFYVEGFPPAEGERFLRLVRKASASGRTVIVYKAGKTPSGAKAAASHTASLAGDYAVARTLLADAGAIVCETLNMFEDLTKAFAMLDGISTPGRRVAVLTNAGFEAGAAADHLYDLTLAELEEPTRAVLEESLPDIASSGNPIDVTPMADTAAFVGAARVLAQAAEVDALVVSAVPATPTLDVLAPDPTGEHDENLYRMGSLVTELIRLHTDIEKPLVVTIDSGRLYDPSTILLQRAGIPVYRKIDRATRALSAWVSRAMRTDL